MAADLPELPQLSREYLALSAICPYPAMTRTADIADSHGQRPCKLPDLQLHRRDTASAADDAPRGVRRAARKSPIHINQIEVVAPRIHLRPGYISVPAAIEPSPTHVPHRCPRTS
jgi:hypothetical protein